jgi:tetratricopeptide (TPR) repeat protein
MTDRINQLRNLLESQPDDTFCLYGIAMEYAKAGQHERAIAHFDLTTEIDPDYCYAYYHKARCLLDAGKDHEAATTLATGLQHARDCGDVHAESEIAALLTDLAT